MKIYGNIKLDKDRAYWLIQCEPHVRMKMKGVFQKLRKWETNTMKLSNTPENCADLLWFIQRYPLKVKGFNNLKEGNKQYKETHERLNKMYEDGFDFKDFNLALPLREYQKIVPATILEQGYVLCADDLGTGKTVMGIATLTEPEAIPGLVVCQPHLMGQWQDEVKKFLPQARVHQIVKGTQYLLPRVEVYIISYHNLHKWIDILVERINSVIFDEVQELRRVGKNIKEPSLKYGAAAEICRNTRFQSGYSATPVYNYGDEIFNILNCLKEGCLGEWSEFEREWCESTFGGKVKIINPRAFGSYLRDNHLMIRRTRKEIGRELPPVTKIPHHIDCDAKELDKIKDSSIELCKRILHSEQWEDRGQASREFDMLLRQATGVAKAPYVAQFIKMLLETEEKVVLWAWHREVYSILKRMLIDYDPVFYTGKETPAIKKKSKDRFVHGKSRVLIMSLRSGTGLNDLQKVCWTGVFGELDWSPGVLDQCIGRLERDEQKMPMTVYYLMAGEGSSDPVMADVLGLKKNQAAGIMHDKGELIKQSKDMQRIKTLAEQYYKKHKGEQ